MKHYRRELSLKEVLQRKSAFLLGPRSTGKTSLYQDQIEADRVYDLLEAKTYRRLQQYPEFLFDEIQKKGECVVIDEVQKLPALLDEVQRAIQKKGTTFLLTGSSARKLKKVNSNLLGGRATHVSLFPLTSSEIPDFDLMRYLNHGGIPRHYLCAEKYLKDELDDYIALYLREEIAHEAATRSLDAFARFLDIMALHSGDELAVENFSSDCAIKASTFRNYIEILKDTLAGFEVPPYLSTNKRKAITRSKFYLFDVGLTGYLAGRGKIEKKNEVFGKAFEHFIAQELRAYLHYRRLRLPLCYWRSTSQFEVDFIIGNEMAIEVKGSELVHERYLKGLRALMEERQIKQFSVVSLEPLVRRTQGITIYPWKEFLTRLWSDALI